MTEGPFPELVRLWPKERGGRWGHALPFMRGSTIVRSQTFSPGARNQYVCRVSSNSRVLFIRFGLAFSNVETFLQLYRSDSDSSTLPKKSPFVRNTLERRTLRYKQAKPRLFWRVSFEFPLVDCVLMCVSSSRTAPPWLSSRYAPPWTWSWIFRLAGPVRSS